MKKILLNLLFAFGLTTSFAQNAVTLNEVKKDWKPIFSTGSVSVDIRRESCEIDGVKKSFDYAFLKLSNSSNEALKVSFQVAVTFNDGTCEGCEANAETVRTVELYPNDIKSGDCSFSLGQLSVLLKNPFINSNGVEIQTIEIINLSVTKL